MSNTEIPNDTSTENDPFCDKKANRIPSWAIAMKEHTKRDEDDHKSAERKHWNHQERINISTIIISTIALIGAFITIIISKDSLDAAIFSANQAQMQADAAQKANAIASAAITQVQRAFITVSELKVEHATTKDGNDILKISPVIKNSGNTPAIGVNIVVVNPRNEWILKSKGIETSATSILLAKVGAPVDPDSLIDIGLDNTFTITNFQIAPQGVVASSKLTLEMAPQEGLDAQSGRIGRFIYGSIRYHDVFNSEQHISRFCFRIDGFLMRKIGDYDLVHDSCQFWNCTDKYCDSDKENYVTARAKATEELSAFEKRIRQLSLPPPPAALTPQGSRSPVFREP